MSRTNMDTISQFNLTVQPKDAKGNPAPVENPTWLTNNSDVLSLTPSADGLSCLVKAVGIPTPKDGDGNHIPALIQFSCDARIGEGVSTLLGTHECVVKNAEATTVELVAGPVEVQP